MANMNKFIVSKVLVLVVAVVYVVALPSESDGSWYGEPEEGCSRLGGQCLAKDQCQDPLWESGELCPNQAKEGYQCCLGFPKDERRCKRRGGECQDKGYCKPPALYSGASDCRPEQDCCILL